MQRTTASKPWIYLISLLVFAASFYTGKTAFAQMGRMMDENRCPMCGRQWDGTYSQDFKIPETLPAPASTDWVNRLEDILKRERLSRIQYEMDSQTYNLRMPYMRIIPDERNHISWIENLFSAYGRTYSTEAPEASQTRSPEQAYEVARQLEKELIPDYEWLITNASDAETQQVLETVLFQTRMHYTMFDHALRMGGMMGGRGHMMGR